MRQRRVRPRTDIPDWRDPEMPVVRTIKGVTTDIGQERVQRVCQHQMHNPMIPNWRNDPSYWWSKRK